MGKDVFPTAKAAGVRQDRRQKAQRHGHNVDVTASKQLSSVLRHDARTYGLHVRADGYVKVSDIIRKVDFFAHRGIQEQDIIDIVKSNDKQRFGLCTPEGETEVHVRAHQGHSMHRVEDDTLLQSVEDVDVTPSKQLSSVLRHNARTYGLHVRADGYVKVSDIIRKVDFFAHRGIQEQDIIDIVANDDQQRFGLCTPEDEDEVHVRAHQGHSMHGVEDDTLLQSVEDACEFDHLCHGTFERFWGKIQREGLKTMGRNHVHCAPVDLTAPEHQNVVMSGTRGECDVVVFIDVGEAMAEGISFQRSDNDVVLTRGHDNVIPPHLFLGVSHWDYEKEVWNWHDLRA